MDDLGRVKRFGFKHIAKVASRWAPRLELYLPFDEPNFLEVV